MKKRKEANKQAMREDWHKEDQEFLTIIFWPLHIMPAFVFIVVLDQNLFLFYEPFFHALLDCTYYRFSIILKWDNLYFHHSQDLFANNIVSGVSCKFIQTIVVQAFNIFYKIPTTFSKLYHMFSLSHSLPSSLHLYLLMHRTIRW
jgi:hypothetical protein